MKSTLSSLLKQSNLIAFFAIFYFFTDLQGLFIANISYSLKNASKELQTILESILQENTASEVQNRGIFIIMHFSRQRMGIDRLPFPLPPWIR